MKTNRPTSPYANAVRPVTAIEPAQGLHAIGQGPNEADAAFEASLVRAAERHTQRFDAQEGDVESGEPVDSIAEMDAMVAAAKAIPAHERTRGEQILAETPDPQPTQFERSVAGPTSFDLFAKPKPF